ncbi:MAG TPA: PAS domain-containing protein, partial [Thermoanaerobaculia bacterium]|nr:PAS domain-containing protein [Thermoanaerobaculia bacterium]
MSDHFKGRTTLDPGERTASGPGQGLAMELAQALVHSSLDGILAFDRDLRYTLWNPAMERLSGMPASQVLGRVAFEVFPFLVELGEDQAFREALAGRHMVTRDRPFTVPETGYRGFFEGSYSPLRVPSGEIVGGLAVIRDVTERKRAEVARFEAERASRELALLAEVGRELSASLDFEEMLQRLAGLVIPELADYSIVDVFTEEGSIRRAAVAHRNAAGRAMMLELQRHPPSLGAASGIGIVLRTGEPLLTPEVRERHLRAASQDEEQLRLLTRLDAKSSLIVPLLARGRVLGSLALAITEGNRRYGAADLALAEELAQRAALAMENARLFREAQEAARRLEENVALLDTLLVSAPVGIAFLDKNLRFARINAVMAELMGVDSAAVAGRLYREVLPDLAPRVNDLHQRVLETGEPVTGLEVSGETPAAPGKRRHFLANYYPIRSRDGSTAGMGAAVVEITERKRAEEALRETNETLRALIQS